MRTAPFARLLDLSPVQWSLGCKGLPSWILNHKLEWWGYITMARPVGVGKKKKSRFQPLPAAFSFANSAESVRNCHWCNRWPGFAWKTCPSPHRSPDQGALDKTSQRKEVSRRLVLIFLGGGVPPGPENPYTISDQNIRLSIPYFRPDSQNVYLISDPVMYGNFGNSR